MDLIEQARVHELDTEMDPPIPPGDWCAACHCEWPCLTSQLAEALAASQARVARLEAWARKRGHMTECRKRPVRQRPNGDAIGISGPCNCGFDAVLADLAPTEAAP